MVWFAFPAPGEAGNWSVEARLRMGDAMREEQMDCGRLVILRIMARCDRDERAEI